MLIVRLGLELGVCDGGLDERWEVVAVAELAQVSEERIHPLRRRRDPLTWSELEPNSD